MSPLSAFQLSLGSNSLFLSTLAGDTVEYRNGEAWGSETKTTSAGLSGHFGRWEN